MNKINRKKVFLNTPLSSFLKRHQQGLTLIELIIAMAIMLVVLTAVLMSVSSSTKASAFQRNYSQVMENGQTALNILTHYIRSAGYQQFIEVPLNEKPRFGQSIVGCRGDMSTSASLSINTWGATCLGTGAGLTGSDSLAVRYQGGGELSSLPGLTTGTISSAIQDCAGVAVSGATNEVDRGDGTNITIIDNRFFIDDNNLVCHGNGAAADVSLVTGIEQMRFWYGVGDKTPFSNGTEVMIPQVTRYVDAAGLDAEYGAEGDRMWEHVVSVRICVVANSDRGVVPAGAEYIDCNGDSQAMGNVLRRTMYTTVDVPNAGTGL